MATPVGLIIYVLFITSLSAVDIPIIGIPFNPAITCLETNCNRIIFNFTFESKPFSYELIRNNEAFETQDSSVDHYYINDKGTPFTAIRVGSPAEGVSGLINVDGQVKGITYDEKTRQHYFEIEDDPRMSPFSLDNDTIESSDEFRLGDLSKPDDPRDEDKGPFQLRLTILIDVEGVNRWFNGSEKRAKDRAKELANIASSFYRKVYVNLTLVEVAILNADIQGAKELVHYLDMFSTIVSKYPPVKGHHLYHGITGKYYGKNVLGVAWMRGVCLKGRKAGVSQLSNDNLRMHSAGKLGLTMTHEIGHNLFLGHDERDCGCDSNHCVMFPYAGETDTWSSCSQKVLRSLATDLDVQKCKMKPEPLNVTLIIICGITLLIVVITALYFLMKSCSNSHPTANNNQYQNLKQI